MKYPMLKNWLEITTINDYEYEVYDYVNDITMNVDRNLISFAERLDGKTDPYTISNLSKSAVNIMLDMLDDLDLIRYSRTVLKDIGSGSLVYSLIFPPKHDKHIKAIARIFNVILLISWLPILIFGIIFVLQSVGSISLSTVSIIAGIILGTLIGAGLHEASHALSCIAYGGTCYEAGLLIRHFLPGAYVMINYDNVKSHLNRMQIDAAGIQMNFLLTGIFCILSRWTSIDAIGDVFIVTALANLLFGLMNILFADILDGFNMLNDLLGVQDTGIFYDIIENKSKLVKDKGITGLGFVVASYILAICQLALPVVIIINVAEVILCFI
ncbi:MAG: hypothetical protein IJO29_09660 [Oscillospiraceae bacterium]|nr:hypothetical protein [Oscillospiraceae bacterium]